MELVMDNIDVLIKLQICLIPLYILLLFLKRNKITRRITIGLLIIQLLLLIIAILSIVSANKSDCDGSTNCSHSYNCESVPDNQLMRKCYYCADPDITENSNRCKSPVMIQCPNPDYKGE